MDEDGFLSASRVAIVGLGLMGGSLALALKGKCQMVLGIDADPATVELARKEHVVDEADTRIESLLPAADLVVLATPVRTILRLLGELPRLHPGSPVVIDLGSTKRAVLAAMEALPERFDPIGGHPMCGKEKSSLRYAEAAIYQDAPFALAALSRSTQRARAAGEGIARSVGACPLWVEAGQHDRWVAATSHAPYLLSSALVQATQVEVRPMVGPGFRGVARLAGSSPEMMVDILATNSDNIRTTLAAIRTRIEAMETLLAAGEFEQLAVALEAGRDRYVQLVG
jgi:prephenate dehydrogenase